MAARTEVLLGGSPHDPGARCAGSSVSGYTHPSQHRGDLRGFGCVPGLARLLAGLWSDATRPPITIVHEKACQGRSLVFRRCYQKPKMSDRGPGKVEAIARADRVF